MAVLAEAMPVILQLIALGLKWWGAKQDTLAAFENLVINSANEGLISEDTKTVFLDQKAQLEAELAKKIAE